MRGTQPAPLSPTRREKLRALLTLAEDARRLAAGCGFLGLPIPDRSGHYFGAAATAEAAASDSRKVKRHGLGDDSKSAVAQQRIESLGLRGS